MRQIFLVVSEYLNFNIECFSEIYPCDNSQWVGDGYCDSSVNNHECHYDGGDCCGPDINTDYCWGDCYCRDGGAEIINASMSIF